MPTECSATLFACAAVGGGKLRMVERSPPKPMHCCWARRTVRLRDGVACRGLPMLAGRSTRTEGSRVGAPPASAMASEDIMVLMTIASPIVGDVTRLRGELRRPGGNCTERVAYDLG